MSIGEQGESAHPLKIFDVARKQDRFLYALAPMVRYGKLAFRQTVHKYGVDLCWSPMILAKEFNRSSFARDSDWSFSTEPKQPPTIVQFGANVPLELARASALVAPSSQGVDLNCGCPQSWACAETLGAALMNHRELVRDMVVETRQRLASDGWGVDLEKDIDSPKGRSNRLIDWLTIHPRTRSTPSTTPIRTEALEILTEKYSKTLPILLSGDVFDLSTLPFQPTITTNNDTPLPCIDKLVLNDTNSAVNMPRPSNTHLSGFMSARGLLANPAICAGYSACPWEAVETFMCKVARAPVPFKLVQHHVMEMTAPGMGPDKTSLLEKKERGEIMKLNNTCEIVDYLDEKIEEKTGRVGGMRRDL
ncbi:hypothetical protein FAUST_4082 [Fusarium austroamericanum]|uniref:DUS-like FMN-binding domain-containing protein n=1 Tax=Fusarium austroamericanum TaxID=282268 RepID=A0AAN6HH97_FUSAU|nr:hypothetical protein FAUST_4082 [Fusarium austroamericanum]